MPEIFELSFLTPAESEQIKKSLLNLKSQWRTRNASEELFVVGVSCYAEAQADFGYYSTLSSHWNEILRREFSWLYIKLAEKISKLVNKEVCFDEELCLPGFHIINKPATTNVPHVDAQYLFLPKYKEFSQLPEEDVLTFTLAIDLPKSPAGLRVWPEFKFAGYELQNKDTFLEYARQHPFKKIIYQKNFLYMHRGHLLHQLMPTEMDGREEVRITFQGHGVIEGDKVVLYF